MASRLRSLVLQSVRLRPILWNKLHTHDHQAKNAKGYRTSTVLKHWMDARDPNNEEKNRKLVIRQGNVFDEAKKRAKDKVTFHKAIDQYLVKHSKYRKGSVEFIYAAMGYMEEFGVHRDIKTYKKLLCIFPKEVMVAKTLWQAEFMHYPKQQQCAIDLMEKMEDNGNNLVQANSYFTIIGVKGHLRYTASFQCIFLYFLYIHAHHCGTWSTAML